MKSTHSIWLVVLFISSGFLILPFALDAQSPTTFNIQGVLKNNNGSTIPNGNYSVSFRLYTSALGDVSSWSEIQSNVPVQTGVFNAILGKVNPLNIPFDRPYFLGIQIGAEPELSPRVELTSTPYSLIAKTVDNNSISTDKIQQNAVTLDKIAPTIVSSINSIANDGGNIKILAGNNVSIVNNDLDKSITISASGGGTGTGSITQLTEGNGISIQSAAGPFPSIGLKPNILLGPSGSLNVLNQNNTVVGGISANTTNQGGALSISNAQGLQTFGVTNFNDGSPLLSLNNRLGRQVVDIKANEVSDAEMNLKSAAGNTTLRLTTNENAGGLINVFNQFGNIGGQLSTNATGSGRFLLNFNNNRNVLELGAIPEGAGFLRLNNEEGTQAVRLTTSNSLHGRIILYNRAGRRATILGTDQDGNGGIYINDRNETPAMDLSTNVDNGGGYIGVRNRDANQVVKISSFPDLQPYVTLFNRLLDPVAELTANEFSDGEINLRSVLKNPTVQLTANEGAGGLVNVFNSNGDRTVYINGSPSGFVGILNKEKTEMIQLGIKSDQNARITVNNRLGNPTADLESNDFSDGQLQLYSVLKNPTLQLKANDNGGGLINVFRQENKLPKIVARLTEEDGGKFSIFNTDETEMIQLSTLPNRNARIRVNNRLSNPVADLISNEFSDGELTLSSSSKNPTVRITANENAGGLINVFNKSSKVATKISETNGFGNMKIFNPDGSGMAEMSEYNKGGRVVIYNPAKEVTDRGVASMYVDSSSGYGVFGVASKVFGGLAELTGDAKENGFLGMYHSMKGSRLPIVSLGGSDKSEGYLKLFNAKGLNTTFWGHNEFGDGNIELRNNLGNLGGFFTAFKDGGILAVTDGKPGTNQRASIGVGLNGGRMAVFNNGNILIAETTAQTNGEGIARIVNPDDITKSRVEIGGSGTKDGFISTYENKGKRNIDLRANSEGAGIITTFKNDKIQTTLNATLTGGDIEVFNTAGSNTSVIGHQDDGRGKIEVGHSNGIKVARMTSNTDGSGYIGIDNVDKNEVVRLTANTGKGGGIGIKNALVNDIITLSQNQNNGLILVNNANGINTSAMAHQDDGRGKIEVGGISGVKVARMTAYTDGSGYIGVDNVDKLEVVRITANNGKGGGVGIKNPAGFDIINMTQDQSYGAIIVNNALGGQMATITHNSLGAGFISIRDQFGKDGVWITSNDKGGGLVNNFNDANKIATSLTYDVLSQGKIIVNGAGGKEIARIGGTSAGNGLVSIDNSGGLNLAGMTNSIVSGGGYLYANNTNGKDVARVTTTTGGNGIVSIDNSSGINLAGMTNSVSSGGGYLYANNSAGKDVARVTSNTSGNGLVAIDNSSAINLAGITSNSGTGAGYIYTKDASGKEVAVMTNTTLGNGAVSIFNKSGINLAGMTMGNSSLGGYIFANSSTGKDVARMTNLSDGSGYISVDNNSSKTVAYVSESSVNGGYVGVTNAAGNDRARITTNANGAGYISASNATGGTAVALGVSNSNNGEISTSNAAGAVINSIGATGTAQGYIAANSSSGFERSFVTVGTNGGEIGVNDVNGKTRVVMGGGGQLQVTDVDGSYLQLYSSGTSANLILVDKLQHPRAEVKSGTIYAKGPNGVEHSFMTSTSSGSNFGYIGVCNSNLVGSPVKAGMFTNTSNQGVIFADIKNFKMDYPGKPDKQIWYGSLEGPELAAYIRGTGKLINGKATIEFPDHYVQVANATTMTVIVTPLSGKSKGIAVVKKTSAFFAVEELFDGNGSYDFDWEVKCVRKGHEDFEPVRNKSDEPKQFSGESTSQAQQLYIPDHIKPDPISKEVLSPREILKNQ